MARLRPATKNGKASTCHARLRPAVFFLALHRATVVYRRTASSSIAARDKKVRKQSHERKTSKNKFKQMQKRKRNKKEQSAGKKSLQHEIECIGVGFTFWVIQFRVIVATVSGSNCGLVELLKSWRVINFQCDRASPINSELHLLTALVNTL